jgi:hypothetical protein
MPFGRPAMTRNKIRRLELLAGAPPQKGRKGVAGNKSKAVFEAERELSRQAEAAYRRLVSNWQASGPAKAGAGATRGRASQVPAKGKAARQTPKPQGLRFASSVTRTQHARSQEPAVDAT